LNKPSFAAAALLLTAGSLPSYPLPNCDFSALSTSLWQQNVAPPTSTPPYSPLCGATITSNLTLSSDLSCPYDAITIGADNVTLDCAGHTIAYETVGSGSNGAVAVNGFSGATIKNCRILGGNVWTPPSGGSYTAASPININSAQNVVVENNTLLYNVYYGLNMSENTGVKVTGNSFTGYGDPQGGYTADGIYLLYDSSDTISSNTFCVIADGIDLDDSSNNSIIGNSIQNDSSGVAFFRSSGNLVKGNTLAYGSQDVGGFPAGAGLFTHSDNNIFQDNLFIDNVVGVQFEVPLQPWCRSLPNPPPYCQATSTGNVFQGNTFQNNPADVSNPQSVAGNTFSYDSFSAPIADSKSVYRCNSFHGVTAPAQENDANCVLPPAQQIANLEQALASMSSVPYGILHELQVKLDAAAASLARGNNATAADQLNAFINACEAQSGKKLTDSQAQQLISAARAVISVL
jgi:parallel beta-helix repeat protein